MYKYARRCARDLFRGEVVNFGGPGARGYREVRVANCARRGRNIFGEEFFGNFREFRDLIFGVVC